MQYLIKDLSVILFLPIKRSMLHADCAGGRVHNLYKLIYDIRDLAIGDLSATAVVVRSVEVSEVL